MSAQVDHLVVAARTLAEGVQWCEATLGITPGPGGKHPLMSTHNRLFNITSDGFPNAYFEIVAIDPTANDGRENVAGVLIEAVTTSATERRRSVIVSRHAIVFGGVRLT